MSFGVSRKAKPADLERITAAHAAAAVRAIEAGFDAVEVHLGHSYLPSAFLSPKVNHRKDEFGGSLENRAKFARGILRAVRDAVGDRIAILTKLNMSDGVRGGITVEEAIQTAQWIEQDGTVDAFEMTGGSSLLNPMYLFRGGAPVKEFVEVMPQPIKTVMRFAGQVVHPRVPLPRRLPARRRPQGPRRDRRCRWCCSAASPTAPRWTSRWREGFEFVAMGRALLREPDLVNRIAADAATPSLCIHCNLLHADQLRRHALPGDPRGQLALGRPGGRPPGTRRPGLGRLTAMDFELDRGIAVEATGPGEYAATLDRGWVVGGGLNGGYLLAVDRQRHPGRARPTSGQPDPVSVSAYYLTPTTPGPAVVRVRRVREGGRRSTVAASLVQEEDGAEVERITVLAVYGSLAGMSAEVEREIPPPDLPPVEECVEATVRPRRGTPDRSAAASGSAPASTRRTSAGRSASRAGAASSRAGSSSPTTGRWTRSRCCWSSTRCRR